MNTPIINFVKSYADSDLSRLHMPGHKGQSFLGIEKYDITEINGADVLYSADGIIKQSEQNAASLFSSAATFYSTEGSSLCIKAMLSLVCKGKKERPLILAARNVHKAFIYAGALLDFDVEWMYAAGNEHLCSCVLTADEVREYIEKSEKTPDALYITSPDYLGRMWDIKAISELCDEYGIPLLVDNAHGAYLAFLNESLHPINLGATMCCDSAHKTLPVLTGGAYLHISEKGKDYIPFAEDCLALHASTSPSYIILQSLDLCNAYLNNGYREKLFDTCTTVSAIKMILSNAGFTSVSEEPLKLTVSPLRCGYTGYELAEYLYENKICCEFCDRDFAVMMFTPENTPTDLCRVIEIFGEIPKKEALSSKEYKILPAPKKLTLRQAVFAESELIPVHEAEGRICASPTVSCPPAVPVVVSGEIITKNALEIFELCGIETVRVIKEI